MEKSVEARFWPKVSVGGEHECWPWLGAKTTGGYGIMSSRHGAPPYKAHRVSWALSTGSPIDSPVVIRHSCDNPVCVNPRHLLSGSHRDNVMDRVVRGRTNPVSLLNLRPGCRGHRGAGPALRGKNGFR